METCLKTVVRDLNLYDAELKQKLGLVVVMLSNAFTTEHIRLAMDMLMRLIDPVLLDLGDVEAMELVMALAGVSEEDDVEDNESSVWPVLGMEDEG